MNAFPSATRRLLVTAIGLAALGAAAQEAPWPRQTIKLVVPFTAGSGTDIIARAIGDKLSRELGQPVVVDNKPGAGGTIGASQVAAATPDGYTVLIHSAGHVANAALYPGLKYDTLKDFRPVAMLATLPNVLVVSPNKSLKTLPELLAKARANPNTMTYASAGNGSATHMNAEKFRLAANLQATHVPYRGTPEAITDVMGGQVDWFFAPLISALPLINDGKLLPLAVGSPARSSALPNVPTTLEAGLKDSDYTFWVGMFVPAKTPPAIAQRLAQEAEKALQQPDVKERLAKLGAETPAMNAEQFGRFVESEMGSTSALIRSAGIRIN